MTEFFFSPTRSIRRANRNVSARSTYPRSRCRCFSSPGTRDAFAQLELLEPVVKKSKAKLHLIEGADHGFKVPKKFGRTPNDVDEEVTAAVLAFMAEV